jgi:dCMP deaminase
MKPKYLQAFMQCAEAFANTSEADNLKVGCVIVKNGAILSSGLNGTPSGWYTNVCEDSTGITKLEVRHAEHNAILKLARNGFSAEGATMFITHAPCLKCSFDIAEVGISKVYYKEEYRNSDGKDWLRKRGISVIKLLPLP